ncbi:uncharacterized protein LOC117199978 [Orcinus orca]|uniref:uncharacterized protein n=1 Tax=Sagmatias obliquidens TaxID=3371155 RepID=UPI000F44522A|nr:uncharacterized protein LOC113617608 [Lagenorhynchus obliquidens]XP_033277110.1 uncharacterized protein LOC117199978 [Orcinus orca]
MGARAAHSVAPPPPGKLEAGEKFVQRLEGQERSSKQAAREEDERPQVRASGRVDLKPPPGRQKRPQLQPPAPVAARAALGWEGRRPEPGIEARCHLRARQYT